LVESVVLTDSFGTSLAAGLPLLLERRFNELRTEGALVDLTTGLLSFVALGLTSVLALALSAGLPSTGLVGLAVVVPDEGSRTESSSSESERNCAPLSAVANWTHQILKKSEKSMMKIL
jgi:hypothetical protein